ncbi:hypothetical protein [Streptomyces sp. NPDC048157]|uniref:hypothetical protein n=1 Tax=Streptomyces sp. NPDC048157 TaxID=3365503 RepID=UPI0037108EA5
MKFTTDKANAHIVTALGVSGALVLVKAGAKGDMPPVRTWIGLTFAGMALSVMAQSWPDMAGGIAMLVLLTSVFVYGKPAYDAINKATKSSGKSTAEKTNARAV